MSQNQQEVGPIMSGSSLKASVKAAETPIVGDVVKGVFFKQLGLDKLFELDLRHHDELPPASLPTHEYKNGE